VEWQLKDPEEDRERGIEVEKREKKKIMTVK
jgi:hypothetical protein